MSGRAHTGRPDRVLVTRPAAAAGKTAARLIDAGFAPVLFPLTETVSLPFEIPPADYSALTITSAAVFRHVSDEKLSLLRELPLYVVGEGTAQAAREAGFGDVIEGGDDAVRLAATLKGSLPQGTRLLYLAGRVRQPVFEEHMAAAGLEMRICDTYNARSITYSPEQSSRLLGSDPLAAVMLYSGFAAKAFCSLIKHIEPLLNERTRFLCISQRVSDVLPAPWQQQTLIADHPDEERIFRLFSKL